MLSVAGPFVIALPTLWPWSALGIGTYKLTYIPIPYSSTSSTKTARLPRRSRARRGAAVLIGRAVESGADGLGLALLAAQLATAPGKLSPGLAAAAAAASLVRLMLARRAAWRCLASRATLA
jgi:hypothetical protein